MSERVLVFDTTLRDGEQSAGVAFTTAHKLEIALQLERLGVDVIEAGFPCSSPGEMEAVQAISRSLREARVCALARAVTADIDAAWEGVQGAARPRLHVFINTSEVQMAHQLRKRPEQVLRQAEAMVRYATTLTGDVEFSAMDATRTELGFLCRIVRRCIAAGATTINIPDSVGYALPGELEALFVTLRERVPELEGVCLSVHAHNDLGLSTANTLGAIRGGARQVEVTVNGIGERAGNTSLEEVVMALKTRQDLLDYGTGVRTREIYATSKLVEQRSGMDVQWNKAIVGRNSFRHGSGIHQDGMLKQRDTWEIIDPQEIGIPAGSELVLGKLSGRHALRRRVEELGFSLDAGELQQVFAALKALAEHKRVIDDRDLQAIIGELLADVVDPAWQVARIQVSAGNDATPTATLRLLDAGGAVHEDAATGVGPLDAIYRAMNRITGVEPRLSEYRVTAITEGIDAQGEVSICVEDGTRSFTGRASDVDILVASARAYASALNRLLAWSARGAREPQEVVS